jgi:hypothetical protein
MRHINNVKVLREALAKGQREFKIHLCGGAAYSSKHIAPCADGRFAIVNYIDGNTQQLTAKELSTLSNIGNAMKQNAFMTE